VSPDLTVRIPPYTILRKRLAQKGSFMAKNGSVVGLGALILFAAFVVSVLGSCNTFGPLFGMARLDPPEWIQGKWAGTDGNVTFEFTDNNMIIEQNGEKDDFSKRRAEDDTDGDTYTVTYETHEGSEILRFEREGVERVSVYDNGYAQELKRLED